MRFSTENTNFVRCDPAMQALTESIKQTVLALLRPRIEAIDPNWLNCYISFKTPWREREPWFDPMQRHQVKFDIEARYAQINGPKQGTVDITDLVEALIPEPLLAMLRLVDVYHFPPGGIFCVNNPDHRIEIIPNRTIVDFECPDDSGFVYAVQGGTFFVEHFNWHDETPSRSHGDEYTMELLLEELAMDGDCFQAIGVRYLPFSEEEKTPEDILQLRRLCEMRRYKKPAAERDRLEAHQRIDKAIADAEDEARLTPEKRELRDRVRALQKRIRA